VIIRRIHPDYLAQTWDKVSHFIDNALAYADEDYTLEQIKVLLSSNTWLLLAVYDGDSIKGAITVAFSTMPNDRIAFITTIGGRHITSPNTYSQFAEILKQFGATKIQGAARPSVARLWRKIGFTERYIIVEKQI
jgi:hypothetical protein